MKEVRYFYVPQASHVNELPSDEATHALRVLRLKEGDEIFLMDGEGVFYEEERIMATDHKGSALVEAEKLCRDYRKKWDLDISI